MHKMQLSSQYRSFVWLVMVVLALGAATMAPAQPPPGVESAPPSGLSLRELFSDGSADIGGEHVRFSGSFTIEKGTREGTLTISAKIDPQWHVYSIRQPAGGPMKSEIKVPASPNYTVIGLFQADRAPHIKPPGVFPVPSEEHSDAVNWSVPIELTEGVEPEKVTIEANYSGQVCKDGDNGACIPIFGQKIAAKFAGYTEKSATPGEYRPDANQAQVVFKGHLEPAAVARGGKAKLVITAEPNAGWHVYANAAKDPDVIGANKPTLIYVAPVPGWKRSAVKASEQPKSKDRYHEQPVTWTIDFTVPADAPQGETQVTGYIGFQTCDSKSCLPPQAVQFRATIPVKSKEQTGEIPLDFIALGNAESGAGNVTSYKDVAKLASADSAPAGEPADLKTLLPMIGFGLLGGLILNLMPCVLPVIGLKLLSFIQHGGHSRGRIFALNLWFSLGLLSVFLVLATAAAFANLGWGQQFTYTWFKVTMVVVVFAFALSFLGVWEIPIPGFAQTNMSSKLQHQEGAGGAFFKGVFTTLLATPCSGPFLGPVFALTLSQPPLVTYVLFGSVGLGMASPYLLIGAFPALVRWLPKPGHWMETMKQLMGFVLLGTVVYLFNTLDKAYFIPTLALVMAVWLACWIVGRVPIYEEASKQLRQWALGTAVAAAIGWFSFIFLGPTVHLYKWDPYSPETVSNLQARGKTVMIDFTANWCATCQWNFWWAINTRGVKQVVEKNGVAAVLADWTDLNDTIKEKLHELNSNSIPVLAIYPADRPDDVIVLRDAISQRQLLKALREAGPSHVTPDNQQVTSLKSRAEPASQ
jgi:thiol:disulfide interchange protein